MWLCCNGFLKKRGDFRGAGAKYTKNKLESTVAHLRQTLNEGRA